MGASPERELSEYTHAQTRKEGKPQYKRKSIEDHWAKASEFRERERKRAADTQACKSSHCKCHGESGLVSLLRKLMVGGEALQELRAAPGSGWIPGTPNSIWPSLSVSFLGKQM